MSSRMRFRSATLQPLQIGDEVIERFIGGGVVDDVGVGAVEEDDRVQHRQARADGCPALRG